LRDHADYAPERPYGRLTTVLCGVVKVILSFFRHGEEGAVERHRSRLTVNFGEQRNISIFKKHLCDFLGIKERAAKYGFETHELKLYRLGISSGKAENYAIITQGQCELEFPNLITEEGNSELNGTIFYIALAMFYKKKKAVAIRTVTVRRLVFAIRTGVRIIH